MPVRRVSFYIQLAFTLLVCGFLIVPVVMSMLAGITVNYFTGIRSGFTLEWVARVWESYGDTIYGSLGLSLACLVVTTLIGVPAAYVLVRWQGALARAVEELLAMPIAVPGIATALALIVTYGNYGGFRRSWSFILVGHVLFTLPFMVKAVVAVLSSIDLRTLEEGAASLGASFRQRFFDVVLPNCRPGILAGALMVLTISIGEFNMTLLLHTPFTKTLPVGLADSYSTNRLEISSAYTLVFFVIIIPMLTAMQYFSRVRPTKSLPATEMPVAAVDTGGANRVVRGT